LEARFGVQLGVDEGERGPGVSPWHQHHTAPAQPQCAMLRSRPSSRLLPLRVVRLDEPNVKDASLLA
jgi:hypothetical protein